MPSGRLEDAPVLLAESAHTGGPIDATAMLQLGGGETEGGKRHATGHDLIRRQQSKLALYRRYWIS